jgi:hypothetical protein
MACPYATLSETKEYLNVTDTNSDNLINGLLVSATKQIDDYVGYTFEVEYGSDETLYNVANMDIIVLRKYPIVGISSIESGVDYQRVDAIGKIILDNAFTGDFSLSVSFGQNPTAIVRTVCMELVNFFWNRRTTAGLKKMAMGDFSYETKDTSVVNEINDVLSILHEYRDLGMSKSHHTYNQMR